jgi:hypothetical protein
VAYHLRHLYPCQKIYLTLQSIFYAENQTKKQSTKIASFYNEFFFLFKKMGWEQPGTNEK